MVWPLPFWLIRPVSQSIIPCHCCSQKGKKVYMLPTGPCWPATITCLGCRCANHIIGAIANRRQNRGTARVFRGENSTWPQASCLVIQRRLQTGKSRRSNTSMLYFRGFFPSVKVWAANSTSKSLIKENSVNGQFMEMNHRWGRQPNYSHIANIFGAPVHRSQPLKHRAVKRGANI